jgi:hypothetical protein
MKNSGYYPLFYHYFINLTFLSVKTIMSFMGAIHNDKTTSNTIQRLKIKIEFQCPKKTNKYMNAIYFLTKKEILRTLFLFSCLWYQTLSPAQFPAVTQTRLSLHDHVIH